MPSAKKFFERSTVRCGSPVSASDDLVRRVISTLTSR